MSAPYLYLTSYMKKCSAKHLVLSAIFPVGKGGRCVQLTNLPPLCADCFKNVGASTSWKTQSLSRAVVELVCPYRCCLRISTGILHPLHITLVVFCCKVSNIGNKFDTSCCACKLIRKQNFIQSKNIYFLDFKFPPCSESCILSFGYLPGVRMSCADVSEPSVRSIFKGLMKNMNDEKGAGYLCMACPGWQGQWGGGIRYWAVRRVLLGVEGEV
jgi:hypothetical protein